MTALAEALLAAQRQAIGALSKAYVAADTFETAEFAAALDRIGATDAVDRSLLIESLDVLREYGAPAPAPPNGAKPDPANEPASEAQLKYLRDLADRKNTTAPDGPLTKARASEAIDQLNAGTYDPDKWTAPF